MKRALQAVLIATALAAPAFCTAGGTRSTWP